MRFAPHHPHRPGAIARPMLTAALFITAHNALAQAPPRASQVFIDDVTIIDGTDRGAQRHMSILITDGKITAVGPAERLRRPTAGALRISGAGKFVIPGLWDMHTHTLRAERRDFFLPLMIANGVTGTRDMGAGDLKLRDGWRRLIDDGRLVGPRLVGTGAMLDGPLPLLPGSYAAGTPQQAADAVRAIKASGADFVKVYSLLPEPELRAALAEARRIDIPVTGHLSEYVPAGTASDLGQRTFEHMLGVIISISSREDSLRAAVLAATKARDRAAFAAVRRSAYAEAARSIDTAKARALFRRLAQNETWQTPTFTYWRGLLHDFDVRSPGDSILRYVPASAAATWRVQAAALKSHRADFEAILDADRWIAREMRAAGVPFLAGTDALGIWCAPGFALHDELAELVAAGFSPLEAIQTATRNAARFLGASDTLGTIEPGKVADLVMLDGDPLADIHNTRRIATVIASGRVYDHKALLGLLAAVAARNDQAR